MAGLEYLVNLAEAQADPALAHALGRKGQRAPFDRIEWWSLLAEHCLKDEPLLAVARVGDAVCALPVMRCGATDHVRSLANWYSFWARPVYYGGGQRLLPHLGALLVRQARRVSLAPLPAADAHALVEALDGPSWAIRAETCDVNHRLALGRRDFSAYWAARPGRLRETVRRKQARGAVAIAVFDKFDAAAWRGYEAVYEQSWKPSEGSPAFLQSFARQEGDAGNLRLGVASVGGEPVAAQLWTVEHGTAFIHKLAHDERAKAHSPGTLLSHAMFARAIDRDRVHTIDFGTGDDAYKRDWVDSVRQMVRLDLHRVRDPRSWPHMLRNRLRAPGLLLAALQHAD